MHQSRAAQRDRALSRRTLGMVAVVALLAFVCLASLAIGGRYAALWGAWSAHR